MTSVSSSKVNRGRRNCLEQAWNYLNTAFSATAGLKVLLCDDATREIFSVAYSQHQLLQHNVVLVDMLANQERYPMKHFSCVIVCRPSAASLAAVYQELAEGNFASYDIYFTYMLDSTLVQSLANADVLNLVSHVGELYIDSIPVTEWVCLMQLKPSLLSKGPSPFMNPITYSQWDPKSLERMSEGIISMLLSTNRRAVIRYREGSKVSEKLAVEVAARMKNVHATFPDLKATESVLVILDRKDDPITPLLMPWTYEAMIHELIGFQRGNEVVIDDPDAKPEDRVHVVTPQTDGFFGQHRYDDWGQVCVAVSEMVKAYKEMNKFDRNTVSLDEIKNFMNRFPEARKQSVQVTRHCAITSELVAEINGRNLTRLSVLEQDIISNNNVTEHSRLVLEVVQDPKTDVDDALRIVMLYHLHYERVTGNIIMQLKQELMHRQCPQEKVQLIDRLIEYAGQDQRCHEIFRSSTGHMLKTVAKAVGQFGKDVQNVLTQHVPLVRKIINRVYNGTLSVEKYPVQVVPGCPIPAGQAPFVRAKDIIVVYIGGYTFSEAMLLAQINEGNVDNNQETLLNFSKQVSRKLGTDGVTGPSTEPYTAKIEAHVSLITTSMLNSKDFIHSLPS
ncbi:vacuolar protein sorting-associated protein,putative [Leishmania mexicana MHOM/GT/2001/U1103]|uniref:Vacuolar protein sorting-associated protein,putative n=1 Tax=Leishmania mexicana (strain MHOM/GT/2001/U1103) TaxID=929439 RepID=E9ASG3_LEIMU|nr:vacuolar protein sorting-associated protein,putative [Leishmania mexicana MHOM/GT/2001/U1103]CBZ25886.1 vacuolar protein sorting-associated protein,putative [Leishmania mexicana MHOM/GT/2001/U1103]